MRSVRLVTALLTMCLLLSVVGMAVLATDDRMPQLELDGIVSFSATKEAHVIYYSFTAQTDGTYVLYDIDGGVHVSYLTVYADHGDSQNMAVFLIYIIKNSGSLTQYAYCKKVAGYKIREDRAVIRGAERTCNQTTRLSGMSVS